MKGFQGEQSKKFSFCNISRYLPILLMVTTAISASRSIIAIRQEISKEEGIVNVGSYYEKRTFLLISACKKKPTTDC